MTDNLSGYITFHVNASQQGKFHVIHLCFSTQEDLTRCLNYAKEKGWEPAGTYSPASVEMNGKVPVCPVHKAPMLPSVKGRGWYCPKKAGDKFCKVRADEFGAIKA
jgi:hypothetical protein